MALLPIGEGLLDSTDGDNHMVASVALSTANTHLGNAIAGALGCVVELVGADGLDQLAGVDAHGALDLAHAVGRAGLLALVQVATLQITQPADARPASAHSMQPLHSP